MPSSRYRVHNLLGDLAGLGWHSATLTPSMARERRLLHFGRDLARAVAGHDVLLIQRPGRRREELGVLRTAAARSRLVVVDVDDPVDEAGTFAWALGSADLLLAGSQAVQRRYQGRLPRVVEHPTPLDFDLYARNRSGPNGNPVVGWIGDGPAYAESLVRMVSAVARSGHEVQLRIVGTRGDPRLEAALRVASGSGQIELVSSVAWEDERAVADCVGAFDIGLAPFRNEAGGSFKTIQYLAAGAIPIVEVGGEAAHHARLALGEDALVVPPGDTEAMRAALERIATPRARMELGDRARELARPRYGRNAVAARLDRILRSMLEERTARRPSAGGQNSP